MDERKWQEMRELDEAAERAGGYVALPRTLPPNPQGKRVYCHAKVFHRNGETHFRFYGKRLLCNWYKRPFFIKYPPLLDAEGLCFYNMPCAASRAARHILREQQQEELNMNANSQEKTRRLAGLALFTALIVILQLLGSFIRFGPVSVSLVALPIVVGAAVYGSAAGLWLGFVFGMVVLLSGDAAEFFAFSVPGTLLTVLVKGIACGGLAGLVYAWLAQKNRTLAAVTAAIVCPVVNTGVFLLGCRIFFLPMLADMAQNLGFGDNVGRFMIIGLVGVNFLAELGINIVLSPVILRLIRIGRKEN